MNKILSVIIGSLVYMSACTSDQMALEKIQRRREADSVKYFNNKTDSCLIEFEIANGTSLKPGEYGKYADPINKYDSLATIHLKKYHNLNRSLEKHIKINHKRSTCGLCDYSLEFMIQEEECKIQKNRTRFWRQIPIRYGSFKN